MDVQRRHAAWRQGHKARVCSMDICTARISSNKTVKTCRCIIQQQVQVKIAAILYAEPRKKNCVEREKNADLKMSVAQLFFTADFSHKPYLILGVRYPIFTLSNFT
jgi:hypothetical protein